MHNFPDRTFKIFTANEKMIDKYLEVIDFTIDYKGYLRWRLMNLNLDIR